MLSDEQRRFVAQKREEALRRAAAKKKEAEEASAAASASTHQTRQVRPSHPPPLPPCQPSSLQPMKSTTNKQPTLNKFISRTPPSHTNTKPTIGVKLKIDIGDRVKIEFYPYHSAVVDLIKQVPSRNYDPAKRSWTVSINEQATVCNLLENATTVNVQLEGLPANVTGLMNFKPKPAPQDLSAVMDPELIARLFPYQKEGVRFALERDGRVLLADEMGLGKSVQALTIARYYKADWPLLIICPASVKGAWKKQINTFFPIIHRIFIVDKGSDPLPDVRTSNTVAIMSYEQMVLKMDVLKREKYRTIIFDESHMLKDGKARRTKVATELSRIATHVILLSGTPALSRPAELFTQIRLIDHKLFTNFTEFAVRYCDGKQGRFCFEAKGCTNSEELAAIMFKRLMIRRLKVDVLKDLPEKRREVVYVSGPTIEARMEDLQKAKAAYDLVNST
uniref:SWI/SNF-related matrix-associated actin-dependent regulator of chromatin subfamily A-like protein 1 n=1 Tax=Caenorhabditis japonica TaxID=281687 RepID=A0A8R1DIZ3_CAEJA